MKRESRRDREAWTAHVEGRAPVESKYGNIHSANYASKHEADVANRLWALESRGLIKDLKEQVRIVLVEGKGRLAPVVYIADFTFTEPDGRQRVMDAKGFKTPVYRLKKRLAALLLGIEIEEV